MGYKYNYYYYHSSIPYEPKVGSTQSAVSDGLCHSKEELTPCLDSTYESLHAKALCHFLDAHNATPGQPDSSLHKPS